MILFCFLVNFALGFDLTPTHQHILKNFNARLDKLATAQAWTKFINENPNVFPPISPDSKPSTVVTSEVLAIDNDTFTIGIGHTQSFAKTKFETYRDFLNSPQLFQFAYGLDGPSKVNDPVGGMFLGRLQKKVPGIEDQDFTLQYRGRQIENFYFVRAPLSEDKKNFALRDNLKVLEKVSGGVIAREISIVYPLRWWVRAMSGTMKKLMKKEMTKVSQSEKCLTESENLQPETAKLCWQKAQ